MGWVKMLLEFGWGVVSSIWRTDKPPETKVTHEKPKNPVDARSDSQRLRECGVRPEHRPPG